MGKAAAATWQARIAEQQSSGESVAGYCALTGVSRSSFYRWRRIVAREAGPRARFLPVHVVEEVTESSGYSGVEIVLRGGQRIELQCGFDADALRAAVVALDGARC